MGSSTSWISSMKMILISTGFLSLAIVIKFSLPAAVNAIPAIWSVILSWMKPPYLYIIINGIIISIAAVSRFGHSSLEQQTVRSENLISFKTPPPVIFESLQAQTDIKTVVEESKADDEVVVSDVEDSVVELKPVMVNGSMLQIGAESEAEAESSSTTYSAVSERIISPELDFQSLMRAREKPLVSSRFGHRKPIRASPEGARSLRVSRPKKHETLESTWRTITEGRHVPLTRHHRKSEPWVEHHRTSAVDLAVESESHRSHYDSPRSMIRKEFSVGHEDLNRRVEAFINKFNEEMRMQRQESLDQYREMMKRGV